MEEMPPGYRFYPTEEELVSFYLHKKLEGRRNDLNRVIPVLDIFEQEPCHLPKLSGELCHRDLEQWFFFVPRQEREARGGRPSRTTASGYWKATGSPNYVYSSDNRVIGMKKTMVFYKGKAPSGRKTKWKMNEYKAIHQETSSPFGCAVPKNTKKKLKESNHKTNAMESNGMCWKGPSALASQSILTQLRHELSVCRVYVVQGSSRAFDRRPLGAETRRSETQQIVHGHEAMAPSQAAEAGEKTSWSPESSYSGEDHFELPQTDLGNINGQELPLWEWEELNWP